MSAPSASGTANSSSFKSRNKLDITRRYPELHGLAKKLLRSGAVLDGEIIALDEKCRPSFHLLQYRMHAEGAAAIAKLSTTIPVWYVVFDVLWFRGKSVMDQPYSTQRGILEQTQTAKLAGWRRGQSWHKLELRDTTCEFRRWRPWRACSNAGSRIC